MCGLSQRERTSIQSLLSPSRCLAKMPGPSATLPTEKLTSRAGSAACCMLSDLSLSLCVCFLPPSHIGAFGPRALSDIAQPLPMATGHRVSRLGADNRLGGSTRSRPGAGGPPPGPFPPLPFTSLEAITTRLLLAALPLTIMICNPAASMPAVDQSPSGPPIATNSELSPCDVSGVDTNDLPAAPTLRGRVRESSFQA